MLLLVMFWCVWCLVHPPHPPQKSLRFFGISCVLIPPRTATVYLIRNKNISFIVVGEEIKKKQISHKYEYLPTTTLKCFSATYSALRCPQFLTVPTLLIHSLLCFRYDRPRCARRTAGRIIFRLNKLIIHNRGVLTHTRTHVVSTLYTRIYIAFILTHTPLHLSLVA